jgi:hypothetical protein
LVCKALFFVFFSGPFAMIFKVLFALQIYGFE